MKKPNLPSAPPFAFREEDIQKCAYFLWKEEGCPSGHDLDLWLAAKELLRHRAKVVARGGRKNCTSNAKKRAVTPATFG